MGTNVFIEAGGSGDTMDERIMMRTFSATEKKKEQIWITLVTDGLVEAGGSGGTRSNRINDENVHCYREVERTDGERDDD